MTDRIESLPDDSEAGQAAVLFGEVVKAVSQQAAVRVEGREVPLFFPKGIDQISLSFLVGKVTISLNISGTTCCKAAGAADENSSAVADAAAVEGDLLEIRDNI